MQNKNDKLKQKIFYDQNSEIQEVCSLIRDDEVSRCARTVFTRAEKNVDRKISSAVIYDIIMIQTGKKSYKSIKNILNRMKKYGICRGCEGGFSQIINRPCDVKKYLLKMGL